jgi:hypothetical protein
MKKFAITLVVLVSIALPVFAAALNGCIDLDGSKAAEKAALLKSWADAEKAPVARVEIGEVTVKAPVVTIDEVQVVGTVTKPAPKMAKVEKKMVCRYESLNDGDDQVKFCSTLAFREAVDRSEGSI